MKKTKSVFTAFTAGILALSFQSAAIAVPSVSELEISGTETPDYVVINPADKIVTADGDFYPVGAIDSDTTLVILEEDGSLPGGLTQEGMERLLSSEPADFSVASRDSSGGIELTPELVAELNGTPVATAAKAGQAYGAYLGKWSTYTGTSRWGTTDSYRVYYSFDVTSNTVQMVQGQGYGYYTGYNGSQMGVWGQWYAIGVATDGNPKVASVPWGKKLGSTQFRAKSVNTAYASGYFGS